MLQARELPQVTVPENLLPYDERSARENIEKAAYLGFAKAQVKMGAAFELCALGCEFDPTLSLHYNALAARQGEPEAEMAISKWFLCGHENIFKKNEELAYIYANRAAQSSLPTAEFALGYFYEIGLHVPADIGKATEWYQRAADHGNEDAKARIEGLNKSGQTLSKKDHENVAINRIKSQYGSKRGGRPARFQNQHAQKPSLGTVTDEPEEYGQPTSTGRSTVPPRGSSITPYPETDGPPIVNEPPRASTVAPYPLDDAPPKVAAGRPGFAGGFAPELRSASAAPQQMRASPGEAFQINPQIYNQGPQGRQQTMPMRPATTVNDMRVNAGRPPNQRLASGPAAPGGGRPLRMDSAPPPQAPPKVDIGFQAPPPGGQGYGGAPRPGPGPGVGDIGFVAPLQPRRSPAHSPAQDGAPQNFSRPPRADSRVHGQDGRRPSPAQNQAPPGRPGTTDRPHRQDTHPQMAGGLPPTPAPGGVTRKDSNKPAPHPSLAPPRPVGQTGPKTFDAMGIPQAPKDDNCVSSNFVALAPRTWLTDMFRWLCNIIMHIECHGSVEYRVRHCGLLHFKGFPRNV
jgi:Sel1 repeat